jgi:hypothetical protein
MRPRDRGLAVVIGVLSAIFGGLMVEGGLLEVVVYAPEGLRANVLVGAIGFLASALIVAGGIALLTRRSFARSMTRAGAQWAIPVHLAGFLLGYIGGSGLILGVVYPAFLLVLLRTRPRLGGSIESGAAAAAAPENDTAGTGNSGQPRDIIVIDGCLRSAETA